MDKAKGIETLTIAIAGGPWAGHRFTHLHIHLISLGAGARALLFKRIPFGEPGEAERFPELVLPPTGRPCLLRCASPV